MLRYLASGVLVLLSLVSASCGYSLSGRGSFLPSYIKIVGVPTFTNTTPYFEVEQLFTERVRSEFIGRGKYQVLPQEDDVDAVLRGTLMTMAISPANFNEQQQASRYVVAITMKVEFFDMRAGKILWENPNMNFRDEYDLPSDFQAGNPQAFFGQGGNALERVSQDVARSIVSSILEAF